MPEIRPVLIHETSHTLLELIGWFEQKNISFVNSIPLLF